MFALSGILLYLSMTYISNYILHNKNIYIIFIIIVRQLCPILNLQGCKLYKGVNWIRFDFVWLRLPPPQKE